MVLSKSGLISVECPCCGARLGIDDKLHRVVSHDAPPPKRSSVDLDQAAAFLKDQASRREELFRQSAEDMKTQSQTLDRKFEEALQKTRGEPVARPTRDIDLD
ncbi:MAG TPA: hypothetical protein VLL97_13050 [Acidobacteriota bacterium]|nr:hypothetical protein [Acidobacteriota bacterium]